MIPIDRFLEARETIRPWIEQTPVTYDPHLNLFFKWENSQVTGSFKARGALNKVLHLPREKQTAGLITASAGNHGQGLAYAGTLCQAPVEIFVSEDASPLKIRRMQEYGARLRLVSGGYAAAEQAALDYARQSSGTWVSAYNDEWVIAGQGTLFLEILEDIPQANSFTWVVPVGGGGLISGIGACLHQLSSARRLIGVQAANSPFFYDLYHHGTQSNTQDLPTLADGLAGAIEESSITISLVRTLVDDIVTVTENELIHAMQYAWKNFGEPVEPAGAAGLAACLSGKIQNRPAVVIISGGNIAHEQLQNLISMSGV
jgi:threonine dehydratase